MENSTPPSDALRARLAKFDSDRRPAPTRTAVDPGQIFAAIDRPDGTQLRVSVHTYEGKPYVRVAPWQSKASDAWPLKGKGCSLKMRELSDVARALLDAIDAASVGGER